mmetsp:Transcript_872/g.2335  ORF Transcript_872/g.2335 Transcript_872/m.2335 type:complete len:308 (+) Transcript_872:334-1257(+)
MQPTHIAQNHSLLYHDSAGHEPPCTARPTSLHYHACTSSISHRWRSLCAGTQQHCDCDAPHCLTAPECLGAQEQRQARQREGRHVVAAARHGHLNLGQHVRAVRRGVQRRGDVRGVGQGRVLGHPSQAHGGHRARRWRVRADGRQPLPVKHRALHQQAADLDGVAARVATQAAHVPARGQLERVQRHLDRARGLLAQCVQEGAGAEQRREVQRARGEQVARLALGPPLLHRQRARHHRAHVVGGRLGARVPQRVPRGGDAVSQQRGARGLHARGQRLGAAQHAADARQRGVHRLHQRHRVRALQRHE